MSSQIRYPGEYEASNQVSSRILGLISGMVSLSGSLSVYLALAQCAYLNELEVPDLEEPNDDGHDHESVDDGVVHVNQQHRDQVETLLNSYKV